MNTNLGQVTVTPKVGAAALLVSQAPVASRVPCMVIGRPRSPSRRIAVPRPFRSSFVFPQGRWKALIGRPIRFGSLYRTLFAVPGDLALPLQPHLCHPAYARNPSVLYVKRAQVFPALSPTPLYPVATQTWGESSLAPVFQSSKSSPGRHDQRPGLSGHLFGGGG